MNGEAGKGDTDRTRDGYKYRTNYDQIEWEIGELYHCECGNELTLVRPGKWQCEECGY